MVSWEGSLAARVCPTFRFIGFRFIGFRVSG